MAKPLEREYLGRAVIVVQWFQRWYSLQITAFLLFSCENVQESERRWDESNKMYVLPKTPGTGLVTANESGQECEAQSVTADFWRASLEKMLWWEVGGKKWLVCHPNGGQERRGPIKYVLLAVATKSSELEYVRIRQLEKSSCSECIFQNDLLLSWQRCMSEVSLEQKRI